MRKPIRHAMMWGKDEDDSIYVFPVQQTNGNWVKWEDYARLNSLFANSEQENARLKTEVEHLMIFCNCTLIPNKELQDENARLQAEVERLRKAIMDSVEMRQRLREIEEGKPSV